MAYDIGHRVADYDIIEVLGSGGMGKVYKFGTPSRTAWEL